MDDSILCNLSSGPHAFDDVRAAISKHYTVTYADNLENSVGAQFTFTEIGVFVHLMQYCGGLIEKHGPAAGFKKAMTPEGDVVPAPRDERLLQ
eukprot:CAMPEP_0206044238 /NCGR_PEP_ID=MMETSP1466-20131121/12052_1 /ASSEMBLY_ACC=CAM_ASM_001126 /TAXON_ID=44452 /ORGANISM="Pavlova gyrans, Strain CCMP608" /LENGTH=92 /DNA_ID=CAMNT_0053419123 /DNA_START=121 /DNA_END=396 /DNA_ORIENTATION=+